jgi:hypothetical protein
LTPYASPLFARNGSLSPPSYDVWSQDPPQIEAKEPKRTVHLPDRHVARGVLPQDVSLAIAVEVTGALLLWIFASEGGIQLILFDARSRVAALIKILFFGAIAHHAGMNDARFLFGVRGNRRIIYHIKSPSRGVILSTRRSPCRSNAVHDAFIGPPPNAATACAMKAHRVVPTSVT